MCWGAQSASKVPRATFGCGRALSPYSSWPVGSGLAPILAILEEAVASRVSRSATLLFGAREEQDLYALDAIHSIAQRWHGKFQFVPVLSAVGEDSTWTGKRGFVTEAIPELLENDAHVYLCGPPVMIDGALELLEELSVPSKHIYFDRFPLRPMDWRMTRASLLC